jgi:excisionase family DNA binding protein
VDGAYIGSGRVSERLLDAREVAELLHVPVSWVRESTRSGAMPCVELGRYRRYVLADVVSWLEQCKQPGRSIRLRSMTKGAA